MASRSALLHGWNAFEIWRRRIGLRLGDQPLLAAQLAAATIDCTPDARTGAPPRYVTLAAARVVAATLL